MTEDERERVRIRVAKYRASHPEKVKEMSRRYYLKYRDRILAREAARRAAMDPEMKATLNRKYRKKKNA